MAFETLNINLKVSEVNLLCVFYLTVINFGISSYKQLMKIVIVNNQQPFHFRCA